VNAVAADEDKLQNSSKPLEGMAAPVAIMYDMQHL
jgi:hypothetical protein